MADEPAAAADEDFAGVNAGRDSFPSHDEISAEEEDFTEIVEAPAPAEEEPAFFEVAAKDESPPAAVLEESTSQAEPQSSEKPVILPGVFDDLDDAFSEIDGPAAEEKPAAPAKGRPTGKGQGELSFDGGPRGRFEGASPSLFEGEDLDVPAFLRKKR